MKKSIKKIVALLVTMGICSSFAFTVQADAYDHIGFDYMQSVYAPAKTQQLRLTAYDANGDVVTFSGNVRYSSSDEKIVKVSNTGVMTTVNYGLATVTATSGNLTASMLVTVRSDLLNNAEGGAGAVSAGNHSTDLVRTGSYSYKLQGGTDTSFSDGTYSKINSLLHQGTSIPANAVIDVWFYDNGNTTDSEAGVYMSPCSNNANGAKAVGILNASDSTYKVTAKGARLTQTGGNWNNGNKYGVSADVMGTPTDTGIARTKGWHQVTYVRKNADASQTIKDNQNNWNAPKSTVYYIYLDGQQVYTETADRSFVYLYGYAGFNSSNYAYIADPTVCQYVCVEGVTQSESSGTYTINYDNYYGKAGSQTIAYNWQVSDDGVSWTDISGATNASYTPTLAVCGDKFFRGGVRVIAGGIYPFYYYTLDENYLWDGSTYQSISLGKNTSYYTKASSNNQLNLVGYDKGKGEHSIASLSGATFTSSNESVVTVTNAGVLTAEDYGIATVTATYGGLSATMLVTVTNNTINNAEGGAGAVSAGNHSTDLVRKGSYSYKLQGGTDTSFSDGDYAKINSILHQWNTIPANAVIEAWFYDNGNTTDSEAGVYMSPYSTHPGPKAVGILTASDTTYKVSTNGVRLSKTNGNWNQANYYGMRSDEFGETDTGIARSAGWHQVAYVRKNTDASATTTETSNAFPKSTVYYIYLDGQQVYTETKDLSFVYLYGYAGYYSSNYAYIADPKVHQYIGVENVNLTESNSTFTINHEYYGTTGTQTPSYKWQVSDDGETGWTDIAGATSRTYAPTVNTRNKYVRGLVSVTTSATTGYRNSESERPNFSLISATADSTQVNVSLRIVNDTGVSIPYALMVGYFNSDESDLVAFDGVLSSVASGSNKTSHTFTIPTSARGNYSKAKIFLWQNITNAQPYTQEILVQ